MSKKCVICGIELDETAAVCPKCGTHNPTEAGDSPFISIEPAAPVVPAVAAPPKVSVRKKRKRLPFILGGAAVVIVAVVVLVIALFGGATKPAPTPAPTLLDNAIAFANGNLNNLEDYAPQEYWDWYMQNQQISKEEALNYKRSWCYDHITEMKTSIGDFTATAEIIYENECQVSDLQKITNALFEQYAIMENTITAGKELLVQWKLTTADGERKLPPETVYALEINGAWYLVSGTQYSSYYFVKFYDYSLHFTTVL